MGKYDKHKRWRQKNRDAGLCPHCGKPCAPFKECSDRRERKKLLYTLNRLAKAGVIRKIRDGNPARWQAIPGVSERADAMDTRRSDGPDDRRRLPRFNKKPQEIEDEIARMVKKHGTLTLLTGDVVEYIEPPT